MGARPHRSPQANSHTPARRDLANGFILAEILSRYFPADIAMHSFQNVTGSELKKANWKLLDKCLKVAWGPLPGARVPARQGLPQAAAQRRRALSPSRCRAPL